MDEKDSGGVEIETSGRNGSASIGRAGGTAAVASSDQRKSGGGGGFASGDSEVDGGGGGGKTPFAAPKLAFAAQSSANPLFPSPFTFPFPCISYVSECYSALGGPSVGYRSFVVVRSIFVNQYLPTH